MHDDDTSAPVIAKIVTSQLTQMIDLEIFGLEKEVLRDSRESISQSVLFHSTAVESYRRSVKRFERQSADFARQETEARDSFMACKVRKEALIEQHERFNDRWWRPQYAEARKRFEQTNIKAQIRDVNETARLQKAAFHLAKSEKLAYADLVESSKENIKLSEYRKNESQSRLKELDRRAKGNLKIHSQVNQVTV